MRNFYVVCFLCISFLGFSQKNIEPNAEDLQTAKRLKKEYPDAHIGMTFSKDYIAFGYDKKSGKVTVKQKMEDHMINLDTRSDIQKYCFYDGASEVTEFLIQYKNSKKARFTIQDEAYTSDDLFHIDTRVKYATIDFPLEGYRYLTTIRKQYNDIKYFTSVFFNKAYPVVQRELKFEVPDWLEIELKEINFEGYDVKKSEKKDPKKKTTLYTYTIENLDARYKDNRAPGPSYLYPHIMILAKAHSYDKTRTTIFESTQDLYNWYHSLATELENDHSPFKAKVVELTKDATSDEEKIKNIYYWVQDNIRYIAFEDGIAGFKPDEASNVFTKKYGDCKGMANLTKHMLKEAGFDARLTWIGTKRIAYDYSTPNLSVDNHMICTLLKDDEVIFLDGTEKFNPYKEYADRIQGKQVMIEDGDSFILKTVPSSDKSANKERYHYQYTLEDEVLKGTVSKTFHGESRTRLLYYLNSLKKDKKEDVLEDYLKNGNSNVEVRAITSSDLENREIPLTFDYDIAIKNAVSSFDNEVYIDLNLEKELANFLMEERKTDYLFSFKKDLESTTTLLLPPNYKVQQLPPNLTIAKDNYTATLSFETKNDRIVYRKQFTIDYAKIPKEDFENWDRFIKDLNATYNEQIILTKQ